MENQNEILKENSRLREDVERITKHDLKTPLNALIGFPQIICFENNLSSQHVKYIKLIEQAGYQMLNMINTSMDIYKMEVGTYKLKPNKVDLCRVFTQVLNELQTLLTAKSLKVEIAVDHKNVSTEDTFFILAEEMLCHSLFANLVKNTIEASPKDETIRNSMENKENAHVSVQNKGAIPPEIKSTFFEKYITSGKTQGTGLGTYSAFLITKTMNGKINFMVTDDKETTLIVELLHFDNSIHNSILIN